MTGIPEIDFRVHILCMTSMKKLFLDMRFTMATIRPKKEIYMSALSPVNHEIESWQPLEAYQLVESYKKGELKGKLKEIAAKLDADDNPVIMPIQHKK
jgi:hypothetical protein